MKVIIALTILLAVIFVGLPLMAWVFYGVWKYFFDILGIALISGIVRFSLNFQSL